MMKMTNNWYGTISLVSSDPKQDVDVSSTMTSLVGRGSPQKKGQAQGELSIYQAKPNKLNRQKEKRRRFR